MTIHNMMEEITRHCLNDLVQHTPGLGELTDPQYTDILALALNRLPPKYVSTAKGEMFAKTQLRNQVESDVYRELTYAVDKVLNTVRKTDFEDDSEHE
jgi:competence protein ComFB